MVRTIDERLRALARRHEPRVWLLWGLGVVVLAGVGVAAADPVVLVLVLDPELLALVALVGLALARGAAAQGLMHLRAAVGVALRR